MDKETSNIPFFKPALYVDIQGFSAPKFTPKEVSFTYDGKKVDTYLFKSPIPFNKLSAGEKREILWLEQNHHGIKYSRGDYELHHFTAIVKKHPAEVVFVKGHQKCEFIRNYYLNTVNVETMDEINVKFQKNFIFDCKNHKITYAMCSINNVVELFNMCK